MGFRCEFNYILRLRPHQGLDEAGLTVGETYAFTKSEHRVYPVDAPIDLANGAWEIIARIEVDEKKLRAVPKTFRLTPGPTGSADIMVDKRKPPPETTLFLAELYKDENFFDLIAHTIRAGAKF